jgi:hypothetical protein
MATDGSCLAHRHRHTRALYPFTSKTSRSLPLPMLERQLWLFEPAEARGEEVMEPMCGGCGRCAYTPLAGRRRVRTQKP